MTKIVSMRAVVVGGGIAGYSAAIDLFDRGITDIAILTDSREGATSLYAKSDRQPYYRLANVGNDSDSPYRMARTLMASGNMDGDTALVESTLSSRCFYKLLEYGLPIQQDAYGAFISSGASSDKTRRMVSSGSDTSNRIMAALERQVKLRGIPVYDNHQVIRILTDDDRKRVIGVLALNKNGLRERHQRFLLFNAQDVVLATGGPGGLFFHEGYPRTHYGCLGTALKAGIKAQNLGEFTIGLCAVRKSLMMKGAFQAALPRFVSTDDTGRDIQEFLLPYFDDPQKLYDLQKMKADQWSFDVKKARTDGPSLIDLLVFHEIVDKGRHVFMDYRENPTGISENELSVGELPFDRLRVLSGDAYTTLLDQDMDPREHPIEVYPSVIHHNGGLAVDMHFKGSMDHLYVIGEAAGSHGSLIPAGASINQTQVSALRSAEAIVQSSTKDLLPVDAFVSFARKELHECVRISEDFLSWLDPEIPHPAGEFLNIRAARIMIGKHMDRSCSLMLDRQVLFDELERAQQTYERLSELFKPSSQIDLCQFFEIEDLLMTQMGVLSSLINEIDQSSGSRGAHILYNEKGSIPGRGLPETYRFIVSDRDLYGKVQETLYDPLTKKMRISWREARPIPHV